MAFRSQLTIRFGDIDHAGIVYYPRFLHYFHVALEEFFPARLGIEYPTLINKHRIGLPTVHLETDFSRPLRYGDKIEVEVGVRDIGHTSISFSYRVFKPGDEKPLIAGHNIVVCMDMERFNKIEVPDWLRQSLQACQSSSECSVDLN
jgi:4-hydroxybenzoyl-CoA thioesterase